MKTVSRYAREESYREVEKLVFDTVHRFKRQYGGLWEDLISEAWECYAQAYEDHRPEISSFSNHIRYKVWFGLLDHARRIAKRNQQLQGHSIEGMDLAQKVRFSPHQFFSELSPDAQFLGRLVLEPPGGLAKRLRPINQGVSEGRSLKKGLKSFLQDLGWSVQRITETFQEIREALA